MVDPRFVKTGREQAKDRLIEECGELVAALGKTGRFGWASYNPLLPLEERELNIDWVRREMNDVRLALDAMEKELDNA